MEKQSTIAITLGLSIALFAIATSFLLVQQFASAGFSNKPANPAGSNMTGGSNMTAANTTGGAAASPPANPAGAPPKVCSSPTMPKP